MNRLLVALCLSTTLVACADRVNLTRWVDPTIGSGDHGHVFVGANVPYGAVQLGPVNISQGWDWCSGYHHSDTTIMSFAHTHLSGTGIGDLCDVGFMPVVGDTGFGRGSADDPLGVWSTYTRTNQTARAGYYAVRLDRYGVDVELTATKRVGMHHYTYPADSDARVVVDLMNGEGWDSPVESMIVKQSETRIAGYRFSKGWAGDQRLWFVAEFSEPIVAMLVSERGEEPTECTDHTSRGLYAVLKFKLPADQLYAKVALSPVSIDNAWQNMENELAGWDFDKTAEAADSAWNSELSKIKIETTDTAKLRTFYTALYHTMIAPSLYQDCNGDYRGADGKVHNDTTFVNYTTFSLWDTYRAAHPLMTIIHPERMADIVNTMLNIYDQQGELPVWHLMSCETYCMVGNPGISVVADAVTKGFDGFDYERAYEAMKSSAMNDGRGMNYMKQLGYIPYELESEGMSKCMEYAIADWALAQVAQQLGNSDDYRYFMQRSKAYRFYFDPATRFVRGIDAEGNFRNEQFDPFRSIHRDNDYTEGNAWQYTWLVPHDVEGLVEIMGGKEQFTGKLDSLFVVTGDLGEGASPDISGLIGQYAHGNEPSHHIAYLYAMVGQPEKSARLVRRILTELYDDKPAGLCGNEDVGQMSAWYVLSSLGFYQVEPAGGRYWFGSPLFDGATIDVGGGRQFVIKVVNNSAENCVIGSIELNGEEYSKPYIDFKDIVAGGQLVINMKN